MKDLKKDLKAAILHKYDTVENWCNSHNVSPVRFYKFLKGDYNPTLKTLNVWLGSVDLELAVKKKK